MKTISMPSAKVASVRKRRTVHATTTKTTKFSITENLAALCGKYRNALTETSEFLRAKHHEAIQER